MADDNQREKDLRIPPSIEEKYSALDESLWGPGGKPRFREPDFSDVRRQMFTIRKIVGFIIFSTICWLIFYFVF